MHILHDTFPSLTTFPNQHPSSRLPTTFNMHVNFIKIFYKENPKFFNSNFLMTKKWYWDMLKPVSTLLAVQVIYCCHTLLPRTAVLFELLWYRCTKDRCPLSYIMVWYIFIHYMCFEVTHYGSDCVIPNIVILPPIFYCTQHQVTA